MKQLNIHYHDKKSIEIKRVRKQPIAWALFYLRGCFRVQRNLFSYLWNLKTLASTKIQRGDQKNMSCLGAQNVCLLECRKKDVELWDSVFIYRGQKILKNRYMQLGFESRCIILRKGRKWCALSSLEGCWAKAHMIGI